VVEQLALAAVGLASAQVMPGAKAPCPSAVKEIVPVGGEGLGVVSVAVTVHVVGEPAGKEVGEHATEVLVGCSMTLSVCEPLLGMWAPSPP
jgi:hypothetical protein